MNRVAAYLAAAVFIGYLDRVNMSFALPAAAGEFHLSGSAQGVILSMFSCGYVAFMLPSGSLIERFGPRSVLLGTSIFWFLATAFSAVSRDPYSLGAARFATGAAEAALFPACAVIVAAHFAETVRGRYTSFFESASYVGSAACGPVMFLSSEHLGWRSGFGVCAFSSLLWSGAWWLHVRSTEEPPASPPARVEAGYLRIAGSRPVRLASYLFFCYNFCKSFYISWLPSVLLKSQGFSSAKVSTFGTIPFIAAAASSLAGGLLSDRLLRRGQSTARARVLPIVAGMGLSSTSFLMCLNLSPLMAIAVASFSLACLIAASAPIWTLPSLLGGGMAQTAKTGAVMNTISNLGGVVAPIVVGFCYERTGGFRLGAGITASVSLAGCGLALLLLRSLRERADA